MTLTRLGQVTAETGASGEYAKISAKAVTLDSTIVRSGMYSWNLGSGAGVGLGFPPQQALRANFAAYVERLHLGGALLELHASGGAYSMALRLQLTDEALLVAVNDGSVYSLHPTAAGFLVGEWNDVGLYYRSGSDGQFSVYLNGQLFYRHTGNLVGNLDYLVGWYNSFLTSQFVGARLDDLYVDGLTLDEPDSVPSARQFLASVPTNQSAVEWTPVGDTPNWRCIDDPGVPDGDATFLKTLVAGVEDSYVMSPVTLPPDYKIRAVIPTAVAKKGDTGLDARITPLIFDGLNQALGAAKPVGVSYASAWHRFQGQPDGTQWNEGDYANMLYGFRASGVF